MIAGIGIDIVETDRFAHYDELQKLDRIFHPIEIEYCLQESSKSAERFAVRFAAKEALYKALTQALGTIPCPFLTLCKACHITKNGSLPVLSIDWCALKTTPYTTFVTLSHASKTAIAQVVLQKT
jgi:phosphopantetheine--protein transferase-like protein